MAFLYPCAQIKVFHRVPLLQLPTKNLRLYRLDHSPQLNVSPDVCLLMHVFLVKQKTKNKTICLLLLTIKKCNLIFDISFTPLVLNNSKDKVK